MTKKKLVVGSIAILLIMVASVLLWQVRQQRYVYREPTPEDLAREVADYQQGEEELRMLKEANPLVQYLPYYATGFEVHYGVSGSAKTEALYEVILKPQTNPSDRAKYKEEINQLTAAAREWIKSKGINPDSIPIEWTTE